MPIWSLLPAGISLGATLLSKPKKKDFKPNTEYLRRYIANLRGKQTSQEVYNQAIQPALRTIGAQGRKMQRRIGYDVERAGVAGSGIEAAQRLEADKATLGALQTAGEQATALQIQESRRIGRQVEEGQLRVGAEEERASREFERSQAQWKRDVLGKGAELAGTAISQYVSSLKPEKTGRILTEEERIAGGFDPAPEGFQHKVSPQGAVSLLGKAPAKPEKEVSEKIGRILTEEERIAGGFDSAPEGFQWKVSPKGAVSLAGKAPSLTVPENWEDKRITISQSNNYNVPIGTTRKELTDLIAKGEAEAPLTVMQSRRFKELKNKIAEFEAARDKQKVFSLFNDLGMSIERDVRIKWDEERYKKLIQTLSKEFPGIMKGITFDLDEESSDAEMMGD